MFEGATFGTLFETNDGRKAIYIKHIVYNDTHSLLLEDFPRPFMFKADGRQCGGSRYASRLNGGTDIKCRLNP